MRIQRTNRIDRGLILMQTHDDRNEDQRVHMIRTVQHLIERCLLFHMDLPGCVETLAKRANIDPVLTIAVWKGLLKENGDFFRAYFVRNARLYNPPYTAGKYFSTHISGMSTSHVIYRGPSSDFERLATRKI
uniref:Uncharacterized protein n=1 Tax=Picea sitchensis TaxID=3332 RepID=A9NXT8_PICSI|nr:unknown [Picea sitchensis]